MQKSVQITVYVVKPRTTKQEHVSGHRRQPHDNSGSKAGYDRKAQLLLYSQQLRNIACCEFQPSRQKTETLKKVKEVIQIVSAGYRSQEIRTHQKLTETRQTPSAKKIVPEELQKPVQAKSTQAPQPSCFRDWRSVLRRCFIARIFGSSNGKDDAKNKKLRLSSVIS